jgi:lysophospholipid acyltransferase (LPLAT)-like uncharacterized protein/uncharacterized membrane protein YdjX (TVP38/TMEM64 family)
VDVEGLDRLDQMLAEGRCVLLAFWHGKYVPLFVLLEGRGILTFTSRSPRGDIIAEICRRFGYEYVQISDHRGYESLSIMQDALAAFQAGAVAVDGPLGPYRVVKRGAIRLASTLGFTIVPTSVASRRKHILTSRWDRMEWPRLFTRVYLVVGEAIDVPAGLPKDEIEGWARRLRDALEDVDRHAESKAQADGSPSHQIPLCERKSSSKSRSCMSFLTQRDKGRRTLTEGGKRIEARFVVGLVALGILSALAVAWQWTPLRDLVNLAQVLTWLKDFGHNPTAVAIVLAAYPIGGLLMLPTTLLILATVALFGPIMGFTYATLGGLFSASTSYALGRLFGRKSLDRLAGRQLDRVTDALAGQEILAVAAINWSQIVNLTLSGLAAGALGIRFGRYVLGTLIGIAPGIFVVTIFENRLEAAIRGPRVDNIIVLIAVTLFWISAALWCGRRLVNRWANSGQRRHSPSSSP